jgi:hypothetical protein
MTDKGSILSVPVDLLFLEIGTVGKTQDSYVKLEEAKSIILVPIVSSSNTGQKFDQVLDSNYAQKLFQVYIIKSDYTVLEEFHTSKFIYFKKEGRQLFMNANIVSESILDLSMCSFNQALRDSTVNYYINNPEKINYIDNKITFDCQIDGVSKYIFEWNGKVICSKTVPEGNCNDISKATKYSEFYTKVRDFCIRSPSSTVPPQKPELKILNVDKISLDEIKEQEISFDFVFEQLLDNSKNGVTFENLNKDNKEEKVFTLEGIFTNNMFNGFNNKQANTIKFENNKIYFYAKKENNQYYYYSFRTDFLQKAESNGQLKLYFNTKEITPKLLSATDTKDWMPLMKDTIKPYHFKISIEGKEYDILLSQAQVNIIQEVKRS